MVPRFAFTWFTADLVSRTLPAHPAGSCATLTLPAPFAPVEPPTPPVLDGYISRCAFVGRTPAPLRFVYCTGSTPTACLHGIHCDSCFFLRYYPGLHFPGFTCPNPPTTTPRILDVQHISPTIVLSITRIPSVHLICHILTRHLRFVVPFRFFQSTAALNLLPVIWTFAALPMCDCYVTYNRFVRILVPVPGSAHSCYTTCCCLIFLLLGVPPLTCPPTIPYYVWNIYTTFPIHQVVGTFPFLITLWDSLLGLCVAAIITYGVNVTTDVAIAPTTPHLRTHTHPTRGPVSHAPGSSLITGPYCLYLHGAFRYGCSGCCRHTACHTTAV